MINVMRRERFIPHTQFAGFLAAVELEDEGALALLDGESEGYAIDATSYDSVTAAAYIGGPVGGTVATIDTGTPANDLSNVALDASNLVQSGTSPKMVHFNEAPYVRWSPHNLITESETFTGTGWGDGDGSVLLGDATAPDGTTTADRYTQGPTGELSHSGADTLTLSSPYCISFYLKAGTCTWVRVIQQASSAGDVDNNIGWFNVSTGAAGSVANGGTGSGAVAAIVDAGSGWYRCSVGGIISTDDSNRTSLEIACVTADASNTRDNAKTCYVWGATFNKGYTPVPYLVTTTAARIGIPQSYDTAAAQYGILVEPAATNLILRSEDIATTWTAGSGVTINTNDTTAPDGATTADRYTYSGADEYIRQNVSNASTPQSFSFYAKASTGAQWFMAVFWDSTGNGSQFWFDILNGVVGSTATFGTAWTPSNIAITSIGNGWYRCSGTSTTAGGTTQLKINSATADSTDTRDSSFVAWLWGMQVETGSAATSYIPTLGSTVARATDNISIAVSNIPSYSSAISGYLQFKLLVADGAPIIYADDGTNNNWISFTKFSQVEIYVREGGTDDADVNVGVDPGTVIAKGAFRVATNSVNCAVNGTVGSADTGAVVPVVTNFYFGGDDTGGGGTTEDPIWIYYAAILPRSLSDTELDTLTT
jgi:hypothetical protein